ncbi:hypothetical protein CLOM_g18102 [Closterium sp. NIES-68]|nr:hypothetical protein CLOM_g18102 [Closterium sp. NIES-68]GJP72472.1 hypothetical protein CLOP_g3203 [Closterium sp. NIES-67]
MAGKSEGRSHSATAEPPTRCFASTSTAAAISSSSRAAAADCASSKALDAFSATARNRAASSSWVSLDAGAALPAWAE